MIVSRFRYLGGGTGVARGVRNLGGRTLGALIGLLSLSCVWTGVAQATGLTSGFQSFETSGSLSSRLYVPTTYKASQKHPLVVVLHGCLQDARQIAGASRFNALAERENFLVLYPEQARKNNPNLCWNWFDEKNQGRRGEAKMIVGLVKKALKRYALDREKIYLVGFSAGGGMAANLINCYPERFRRVALHSGLSFRAARNVGEAFTAMKQGSQVPLDVAARQGFQCSGRQRRPVVSALVIHGQRDDIVTHKFIAQNLSQLTLFNDWLDDGQSNGSYKLGRGRTRSGEAGGYNYTYKFRPGPDQSRFVYLSVRQLGHAWSGGNPDYRYTDAGGPVATKVMWRFFTNRLR